MKEWTSSVYGFFHPELRIEIIDERRCAHVFKCLGKHCKVTIRHFLDTQDARSMGNMRKHVRACLSWGSAALEAVDSAADANEVRTIIVPGILKNGSITALFERKGKGKRSYSNRPLTHAEIKAEIAQWVCVSVRPFDLVSDEGFLFVMKTGRPELYIPSPSTVSRDVRLVFAWTCQRVATMLNVS